MPVPLVECTLRVFALSSFLSSEMVGLFGLSVIFVSSLWRKWSCGLNGAMRLAMVVLYVSLLLVGDGASVHRRC